VEEILRYVTPVNHFMRTATRDTELRGVPIAKGQSLALFYGSANRDERVFQQPDRFMIDRHPNPHLALGVGEHFCMGAGLARMEIRVLLEELVPRLDSIAIAGELKNVHSNFVNGLKVMPVALKLDAADVNS
jgi:cytochrome P450